MALLPKIPESHSANAKAPPDSFRDAFAIAASPDRSQNELDGDIEETPPSSVPVQFVPARFM
ncbi:MAG: hypothetical protein D6680_21160 [Cyanobacteria bacterium J007]|nr:MAG: hypothetical protein D6680_21160 [Cyanobacteria bacterium J007]